MPLGWNPGLYGADERGGVLGRELDAGVMGGPYEVEAGGCTRVGWAKE